MILEFESINLAETGDINEAVGKFYKIIEEATAKKSLQPVIEKEKVVRHRQSQVWFDKDCKNIRKRLRYISTNSLHPNVISYLMPYLPPFFYTVRKCGGHMIASI